MINIVINPENLIDEQYNNFTRRQAARGIFFDTSGRIGVLFVTKHGYHKLPGGGVEDGEDILSALERECMEELGCTVSIKEEYAKTTEIRKQHSLVQNSTYFTGTIISAVEKPTFEEAEKAQGFQHLWIYPEDAINKFTLDKPDNYDGWFISQRDSLVLLSFIKQSNRWADF